jgi:predicted dehydrogenase
MNSLRLIVCLLFAFAILPAFSQGEKPPVRIAIAGLVHVHVHGFLPRALNNPAVKLVGIVEPDKQLVAQCVENYKLDPALFFPTLEELLAKTEVQAVAAFTSTFDHRKVVETCAAKKIHVMMEKPLAVNMEHAKAMDAAAKQGGVHLLVNYETTWYAGNHAAYKMVRENAIGEVRKMVVHDGHQGPQEIGCPPEFLKWLTDPVQNGGGALTDFGCYGANLMTWIMQGQRPLSVFAVTQQLKPEIYPNVDDEATIVVTYPKAQGIIQASWNWPYDRKDMEIYGQTGYVIVPRSSTLRVLQGARSEKQSNVPAMTGPEADPVSYLAAATRGELEPAGLSSLENNMTVVEILDAARESAATGKRVELPRDEGPAK